MSLGGPNDTIILLPVHHGMALNLVGAICPVLPKLR